MRFIRLQNILNVDEFAASSKVYYSDYSWNSDVNNSWIKLVVVAFTLEKGVIYTNFIFAA
jgi:hypothetical protein